jgi:hypothetical protein
VPSQFIYVAKFADAVYVFRCFQKKTEKTNKADLDLATKRYRDLLTDVTHRPEEAVLLGALASRRLRSSNQVKQLAAGETPALQYGAFSFSDATTPRLNN